MAGCHHAGEDLDPVEQPLPTGPDQTGPVLS